MVPAIPVLISMLSRPKFSISLIALPYLLGVTGLSVWESRKRENEADYISLLIMAKAGYDIRKATNFWERMESGTKRKLSEKDEKGRPKYRRQSALLAAHPHVSRSSFLSFWMLKTQLIDTNKGSISHQTNSAVVATNHRNDGMGAS